MGTGARAIGRPFGMAATPRRAGATAVARSGGAVPGMRRTGFLLTWAIIRYLRARVQ